MKYFGPKSLVIRIFYRNSDGGTIFFKFSITVVFDLTTYHFGKKCIILILDAFRAVLDDKNNWISTPSTFTKS